MKSSRIFIVIVAVLFSTILFSACGNDVAEEDGTFRVALLLDGNIADGGWNQLPYEGLMKAIDDFEIEGSYTEQIATEEISDVMLDYAYNDYDLIIANGYTFSDALQTISEDFPEIMFIGLNVPLSGPNLATARTTYGINGHLAGVLMGEMTKTKKIGCVAAVDSPQMQTELGNLRSVLETIDPEIELSVVYTGDWSDISLAREGASSLADDGVDIILNNIDGATGAVAALAAERGIYVVGWTGDEAHLDPDVILSSLVIRNDVVLYNVIERVLAGEYSPGESMKIGLEAEAIGFGEFGNAVPQDLINRCIEEQASVEDGSIAVNIDVPGWD